MSQSSGQTVAVTGATGFLGRYTVRALLEQGYAVRALVRSDEKAIRLPDDARVTRVTGDVFAPGVLDDLCDGAHALVHTIGIRREYPAQAITFDRIHTLATRRTVEAGERAGLSRLVLVSALGTCAQAKTAYGRSKWESEQILRSSSLEWTILRPSLIHGPDGEFIQMVKNWVLGRTSPRFFLPYFVRFEGVDGFPPRPVFGSAQVAPVAVEDVANAAVSAIGTYEAEGEIYPIVGPDAMDWPTLLKTVRDAMPMGSKTKRVVGLPAPMGVAMAQGAKFLGLADALPFGPSEPALAAEDGIANPSKAKAHLGLMPRPFAPTVESYADAI